MELIAPLALGLLLGLKHSFEPDHLVAVSTIVSQQKHPLQSLRVGLSWGIGHTITLLIIGSVVLLLKIVISEEVSTLLEGVVGCMIIYLSFQSLRGRWVHHHHTHHHSHMPEVVQPKISKLYLRSLIVGMIHGLAGSGALTVLVLATVKNIWIGFVYMALFGLGSITSMSFAGLLIGLPYAIVHERAHKIEHILVTISAIFGLCFGAYYLWTSVSNLIHF